ncbi:MAG: glycosyltransferase [Peptococcaceae bacterium BRH_c4a]|nr:MAG: glycosyltransferase [Peptococcaceae bacterium BRH_c4a]
MKIVIPALSLEKGGGARFLYQLGNALVDKGQDVEFIIPESGCMEWPVRAKITRVKKLTPGCFPSADFILPNFYPTVMPAWQSQQGRVVRLSLVYEPLCIPNADVSKATYYIGAPIFTISQWQRLIVLSQVGFDSTVISGGVDPIFFRPYPKLSVQTGRKTVFYIMRGFGYTWKGNADFTEACIRLKERLPAFDVVIVNPEPGAVNPPFPHMTRTADNDREMALLYAQADLFVYTSYYESFGLPPLEAMACGTAVVTTDCGGNRDYTRNGKNCVVVPPSDINALTESMYRLLINDSERQSLADAGQVFTRSWTWQRTADQLLSALMGI